MNLRSSLPIGQLTYINTYTFYLSTVFIKFFIFFTVFFGIFMPAFLFVKVHALFVSVTYTTLFISLCQLFLCSFSPFFDLFLSFFDLFLSFFTLLFSFPFPYTIYGISLPFIYTIIFFPYLNSTTPLFIIILYIPHCFYSEWVNFASNVLIN